MPYIGNTIRAADDYRLIDDISSGFNGNDTTFALQVAGSAPVPFPKSPQQVLISVNGVIQEPDPTGNSGFNLVGTNIVFSSAPTNGHAFFGIIYATADYLNAGGNFPAGSLGAPSITFIGDENTGLFRKSGGSVGFVSDATEIANFDSNGITISSGNLIIPDSIIHNGDTDTKIRFSAANTVSVETGGSARAVIDSTGLEVTGSVHASADLRMGEKLKHANDQDTFISFPSNDHIGFTTNNSTRMTITDQGRVGIGSTTPSQKVTIVGSNEEDVVILSTGNAPDNTFCSVRGDNEAGIRIRGGGSGRGGEIELAGGGRNTDPAVIKFSTTTGTSFTERMRIDSSGKVGIGTSSPSAALEVINSSTGRSYTVSSATEFVVERNGNSQISIIAANNSDSILHFSDTDDENVGLIGYDHANNSMNFRTNASERMRIDSDGKLKIGTDATPTQSGALNVFGTDDTTSQVSIRRGSADSSSPRITFQKSRNTTDGSHTVVQSGDGLGAIRFAGNDGAGPEFGAQIEATVDPTQTPGGNDMPGQLGFFTTPNGSDALAERMTIDSTGAVLIGDRATSYGTDAKARLSIDTQGRDAGANITTVAQYGLVFLNDPTTNVSNGIGFFNDSGDTCGGAILHQDKGGSNLGALVFYTAPTANNPLERLRIKADGLVGIGTSSPATALHLGASGGDQTRALRIDGTNNTSGGQVHRLVIENYGPSALVRIKTSTANATESTTLTIGHISKNIFIHSENSSGSNGRIYTNKANANVTTLEVNQNGGSGTEMITFRNAGSQLGTIHQSGASGVSYQSNSDYRLKENDVKISDGITRLKQLRPIRFNWKADTSTVVDGFFAHEVSPVVPEAVRGNKDEVFDTDGVGTQVKGGAKYQQLEQSKLVPLLTAALQEAVAKIEVLETKVAALESA